MIEREQLIKQIARLCDHGIPHYAYGDNEAACDMAARLQAIGIGIAALRQQGEQQTHNVEDSPEYKLGFEAGKAAK